MKIAGAPLNETTECSITSYIIKIIQIHRSHAKCYATTMLFCADVDIWKCCICQTLLDRKCGHFETKAISKSIALAISG